MSRAHRFPVASLICIAAVPLAWLACGGGESKPAESPASESSASASSEAPAASDSAAPAESASAAAPAESASPSSDSTAAAAPSSPPLGSTDCGRCIDKACKKQEAACGKNTDCQSTLDSIHGCTSGAASCIDAASPPAAAKPKKLAAAYESCAKKATTGKTCKAKCE